MLYRNMNIVYRRMFTFDSIFVLTVVLTSSITNAVVTNISVIQIPPWFFGLTPFETVFVGLTFLWICMLQVTGILPININEFLNGSPSGKRKKRSSSINDASCSMNYSTMFPAEVESILESFILILKKLDKENCVPRTICELEYQCIDESCFSWKEAFPLLKWLKIYDTFLNENRQVSERMRTVFKAYTSAASFGDEQRKYLESSNFNVTSPCSVKYPSCTLTINQISGFHSEFHLKDMF